MIEVFRKAVLYCSMAQCVDTFFQCTHLFFTDPGYEVLLTCGAQPFFTKPICCLYVGRNILHVCCLKMSTVRS